MVSATARISNAVDRLAECSVHDKSVEGSRFRSIFESHVLPFYCKLQSLSALAYIVLIISDSTIQAETDLGNDSPRNILTWNGWHAYLEHKVKSDPNDAFNHLSQILSQLRIDIPKPLQRSDLPMNSDPNAVVVEHQFRQ